LREEVAEPSNGGKEKVHPRRNRVVAG